MLLLLLACATGPDASQEAPIGPVAATPAARLPQDEAPFAPTLLSAEGELAGLTTPGCEECHQEEAEQWSGSAHAHASFDNPWYRVSVRSFREGTSFEASRFCGGCHDPALVLSGAMDEEVDAAAPEAVAGVGCVMCHQAAQARVDGNASLHLALGALAPASEDAEAIAVHARAMRPEALTQGALCVSCHRGFLSEASESPMFLFGMDEGGAYAASAYAGAEAAVMGEVPAEDCLSCHMRHDSESKDVSHRFPGGQTSLYAALGEDAQLAATQALLRRAAIIDLPVVRGPDGPVDPAALSLQSGDALAFDVVVKNEGAGHSFPGGLKDSQDTWIELVVVDASGRRLGEAGVAYAEEDDPSAWRLRAGVLDGDGHPELLHQPQDFRAVGWDGTVPPRGARAARYTWEVPELSAEQLPLRVELRLRHRRHIATLHDSACAEQRSRPEFDVHGADACAPQPITELASASVTLGAPGETGGADRPRWERARDHALALHHELQEHLSDGEPSVMELRALAPDDAALAQSYWLEAWLAAHQGRLDDALAAADAAEALIGPHPALDRARGDAYAQVWRWAEAAEAYARVTEGAPTDTQAWRDLALSAGSAGQSELALRAAQRGMQGQPRDESMLRSQALALADLGRVDPAAEAAWVAVRRPDDTSSLRTTCAREVPGCDQWLRPLPQLAVRPASSR